MSWSLAVVRHVLFGASVLGVLNLWPAPIFAQVAAAAPITPGPFGGDDTPGQPTLDLSSVTVASSAGSDAGTSSDATDGSAVSASTDAGPAANPPDPTAEIAPAISVLDVSGTPAVADTSSPSVPSRMQSTLLKRLPTAADTARLAAFLVSDAAPTITGAIVNASSGSVID